MKRRKLFRTGVSCLAALLLPMAAQADWVTVRAGEACQGVQSGDRQFNAEFSSHGVLQADVTYGQHFWCRVEVPEGKWVTDMTAYGVDDEAAAAITVELRRAGYDSSSSTLLASWGSEDASAQWDYPDSFCHQIVRTSYSYYLHLYIPAASPRDDFEVWSYDFKYQDSTCN